MMDVIEEIIKFRKDLDDAKKEIKGISGKNKKSAPAKKTKPAKVAPTSKSASKKKPQVVKKSKPAPKKKPSQVKKTKPTSNANKSVPKKPAPKKNSKPVLKKPLKVKKAASKKPVDKKPAKPQDVPAKGKKQPVDKKSTKPQDAPVKGKKPTKKGAKLDEKIKEEPEEEKIQTLEEQIEKEMSEDEIKNLEIEKANMEKVTYRVCELLATFPSNTMHQNQIWKKMRINSRDGARLALRLERRGIISREKILDKGRWTYNLTLIKSPISTESIINAPCLTCNVEQKCTLEGEVSPRTCQLINDWVLVNIARSKSKK